MTQPYPLPPGPEIPTPLTPAPPSATAADLPRADGALALTVGPVGLETLYQQAPCRALFPSRQAGESVEAVLVNIAGGLTGGDRIDHRITIAAGGRATLTTAAAEKIYRSTGPVTRVECRLSVGAGAVAEWLPQETILYDGARLDRRLSIDLAADARLLAVELVQFGRHARGEQFDRGRLEDRWRVEIGGNLVWIEATRLDQSLAVRSARRFGFGTAGGYGTLVLAGDGADRLLPMVRDLIATGPAAGGASLVGPLLICRWLDQPSGSLRASMVPVIAALRQAGGSGPARLPRVWQT